MASREKPGVEKALHMAHAVNFIRTDIADINIKLKKRIAHKRKVELVINKEQLEEEADTREDGVGLFYEASTSSAVNNFYDEIVLRARRMTYSGSRKGTAILLSSAFDQTRNAEPEQRFDNNNELLEIPVTREDYLVNMAEAVAQVLVDNENPERTINLSQPTRRIERYTDPETDEETTIPYTTRDEAIHNAQARENIFLAYTLLGMNTYINSDIPTDFGQLIPGEIRDFFYIHQMSDARISFTFNIHGPHRIGAPKNERFIPHSTVTINRLPNIIKNEVSATGTENIKYIAPVIDLRAERERRRPKPEIED